MSFARCACAGVFPLQRCQFWHLCIPSEAMPEGYPQSGSSRQKLWMKRSGYCLITVDGPGKLIKSCTSCYDAIMKWASKKPANFRKRHPPVDKAQLVRRATRMTLSQYAETFKDLARYDRTEQAAR